MASVLSEGHIGEWDEEESDSEGYDTDLEIPAGYGKAKSLPEKDRNIGLEVYKLVCRRMSSSGVLGPQTTVLNSMSNKLLSLRNRSLGSAPVQPLCAALQDNIRIERLNLDGCDIGGPGGKLVAAMLLENMALQEVNLANNNLREEGARAIGEMMVKNNILKHLNLSGNYLTDGTARYISKGIQDNSGLTSLNLSHNEYGETGGKILAAGLVENVRLQRFDISWNQLRGAGAVPILQALKINYMLRSLDISWNGLGYEGTIAVSETLKHNRSLKELNISNNRINWKGAVLIASALKINNTLEILKIGSNPITTTGCMDIIVGLSSPNSALRILDASAISILFETIVMAATIQSQRKFKFLHGDVVSTPDVLGERHIRESTPMERVIDYMRRVGLRPLELIRQFDKTATMEMTAKAFVQRLQMTDIQLHEFERRALVDIIAKQGREKDTVIDYPKFWMAVENQREETRQVRIKEREEQKKMEKYHRKVLASGVPVPLDSCPLRDELTPVQGVSRQSKVASKSSSSLNNQPLPSVVTPLTTKHKASKKKKRVLRKKAVHKTKK